MHSIVREDLESIAAADLPWESLAGKKVLISGAGGFLPGYMVELLLFLNTTRNLNCRVYGLVRNLDRAKRRFSEYADRDDLQLIAGDVVDPIQLEESCDFIIHAASQASPKYYHTDPVGTMTANVVGTYNLLNLARRWDVQGFLLFSSSEVYGAVPPEQIPTKENQYGYIDIVNPRACYAEGKRAGETLTVSYHHQFKIPSVTVRPFHTYGPGMALDDGRVYADFVRNIVNREDIVMRSDGRAIRAFCYLSDAVEGFFYALLKGTRGAAYNVGNPEGALSIGELADLLVKLYPQHGLRVNRENAPVTNYVPSLVNRNIPCVDELRKFGWKPRYSVAEGFARTVRFYEETVAA